jgi:acyl transferase domain-containing protein/NADPH:quinone reductase-like Zn-dependent oxidoreductase
MGTNAPSNAAGHPNEPIAIVGIACRYPGANSTSELWELLTQERNAIREVPEGRFDEHAVRQARRAAGKQFARSGGFLDDAAGFDTDYFGLSPREASRMDPQQRLALELSAEALDDASLSQADLAVNVTGVYMGVWSSDWECHEYADRKRPDVYSITGSSRCVLSGRISFAFDLRGPSLSVDTGCSASMLAAHLACQSLWAGESSIALVGGVNLVLDPWQGISFSESGMISADGQCKAFSRHADGFVRSDGCAVIVLMPLSQALARGSRIYAVIRGSGASNDGASNGLLTTPSEVGQELAIRAAYRSAGLSPNDVQYIEAHGTGTRAGDPVELRTIAGVMRDRPKSAPCLVGSIKSNIGHTEGAAGLAGLIKVALSIHHRVIPKTLHAHEPTTSVPWEEMNVALAHRTQPWPTGIARGGVSSFGISGTNVHMVLEEAPRSNPTQSPEDREELLVISGMREASRQAGASAMCDLLAKSPAESGSLRAICYTASVGRRHHEHRLAVVGRNRREMKAALEAFARGEEHQGLAVDRRRPNLRAPVFVFAGQGRQWPGMGKALFESEPVFRAAFEECDAALSRYVKWSLLRELDRMDADHWPFSVIQPTIFAVQVALSALLRSWGVEPGLVVGHSMGEVAAAYVAGILGLDDAAHIIARRSQNLQDIAGLGGMLAVELPLAEAEKLAARYPSAVGVAVNNSPEASVLSGDLEALQEIARELRSRDVFCRELDVDAAAHSPQLEPSLAEFERDIANVRPNANATVPMCSTVTGTLLDPTAFTAEYWRRNQREPVRFAKAAQLTIEQGEGLFIEIGPHPILLGPLQQIMKASKRTGVTLASMKRDEPERAVLLQTLGQLYALGHSVNFRALYPEPQRFVPLPRYAWQHDAYDVLPNRDATARSGADSGNGVGEGGSLGEPVRSPLQTRSYLWQIPLSPSQSTYLKDHRVQSAVVLPGAAYAALAMSAAAKVFGSAKVVVEELEFARALVLPPDTTTQLQVSLSLEQAGLAQIAFFTSAPVTPGAPASWTQHARGRARLLDGLPTGGRLDADALIRSFQPGSPDDLYRSAAAHGIDYGAAFRGVESLWNGETEALAKVVLPSTVDWQEGALAVHPALLDACWQLIAGLAARDMSKSAVYMPIEAARIRRWREPGTRAWAHVRMTSAPDAEVMEAEVRIFDEDGALAIETQGFKVRRLDSHANDIDHSLYELAWEKEPLAAPSDAASLSGQKWLVLGDRRRRVGAELRALLQRAGADCRIAYARPRRVPRSDHGGAPSAERELDAADPDAIQAWIGEEAGNGRLDGIIDLWALDAVTTDEATNAALDEAQSLGVIAATRLFQALSRRGATATKLWLVSAGAEPVVPGERIEIAQAPLWGLGRVLRNEANEPRTSNIDLRPLEGDTGARGDELEAFVREIASGDSTEVALRGQERWVQRLRRVPRAASDHVDVDQQPKRVQSSANYWLRLTAPGVLDNFYLREIERVPPGHGEIEVEISHAGVNFIDVMKALGVDPQKGSNGLADFLGGEGVGVVTAVGPGVEGLSVGQRVVAMAIGGTGCFARFVRCKAALAVPCPPELDSAQAAALPFVYLTAYYAMIHLGRLARGERVLIHSGTGGVGLAAIELARRAGAEIFATAGTHEKRELLRRLGVKHVFDSRTTAFASEIMQATGGEGIDMVLNSLAGEAIPLSLGLLRDDGRFLEIGKRDIYEDMPLGLSPFRRGLSFSHIDLIALIRNKPQLMQEMLRELLGLVARGELGRLPVNIFSMVRANEAFRLMAQAKHIGKIVLEAIGVDEIVSSVQPRRDAPLAVKDATYLITGGLGGLGLLVADWLVEQGARHLVLTGRSPASDTARSAMARLEHRGVNVRVVSCDVGDAKSVAALVQDIARELPPLRGVIHGAAVLADGLARELTDQQFATAMWPKMHGAFNLHLATEGLPLDFFVLFSSAATILGSPGQGNYAAGNAFMDALARHRRARGLPATTINWGPWSESGVAVRPDRAGRLMERGMGTISDRDGIRLLDNLVRSDRVQTTALPGANFQTWVGFYPVAAKGVLESLLRENGAAVVQREESGIRAKILEASAEEQLPLVEAFATDLIRRVLRIPTSKVLDPELPLNRFGVDSLMALELNNRLEADLGVRVQVSKILLSEGLRKFAGEVLRLLNADPPPAAASPAAEATATVGAALNSVIEAANDGVADLLPDDFFNAETERKDGHPH